jgi:hypothetical protein
MQTLYKVIHYLAEIFPYAIHEVFANFKMMSKTRMKTEILDRNLHAALREQLQYPQ